jgi:hypothetical protein
MTMDLQEIFARAGHQAPDSSLDADLVLRRGRQVRARRRAVGGAVSLVMTGTLALGAIALAGNLPGAGQTSSTLSTVSTVGLVPEAGTEAALALEYAESDTPPAGLADVDLADPAPGSWVRRDEDSTGRMQDDYGNLWWANNYLLQDRSGWKHVTLVAGYTPKAVVSVQGTIADHPVVASPKVAGVTGHVTEFEEKGSTMSALYFNAGEMNVIVFGLDVTVSELVELGNSVTGLR